MQNKMQKMIVKQKDIEKNKYKNNVAKKKHKFLNTDNLEPQFVTDKNSEQFKKINGEQYTFAEQT